MAVCPNSTAGIRLRSIFRLSRASAIEPISRLERTSDEHAQRTSNLAWQRSTGALSQRLRLVGERSDAFGWAHPVLVGSAETALMSHGVAHEAHADATAQRGKRPSSHRVRPLRLASIVTTFVLCMVTASLPPAVAKATTATRRVGPWFSSFAADESARAIDSSPFGAGSPTTYTVQFSEEQINSQYPQNTCTSSIEPWSVTINGVGQEWCYQSGNGPNDIYFNAPNGTYSFTVTPPSGFTVTPPSGTLIVNDGSISQFLALAPTSLSSTTWSENIVPGLSGNDTYQSLACSGSDCYERGVVPTSPTSFGDALWASTDGGVTWGAPHVLPGVNLPQSCDEGTNSNNDGETECIVAFGSTAYALGPASTSCCSAALFETTDNGGTWTEMPVLPTAGYDPNGLSCPTTSDCYVLAGPLILSTTDAGAQWSSASYPGGTPTEITCPAALTCIAASAAGVLETADGGADWQPFGPTGATAPVSDLR